MLHKQCLGFLILLGCCLLEVSSKPTDDITVQYLPFYGGAKGQYLELKTDSRGIVVSENIISEDKISKENIVKDGTDSLLSKILSANLMSLRSLSSSLLRLHNIGRNVGYLNNDDKARFKAQLGSLQEAASNALKTIEDIGDNIDALFKPPQPTAVGTTRSLGKEDTENVGEEGVVIDNEDNTDENLEGATIAEAKPVGLAVIGSSGLAASRPKAVAVALTGVAVARPVATAIAGFNPSDLNIDFQLNNNDDEQ